MPPRDVPPEVRDALATVVGWLARALMETAAAHVKHDDAPEFVDVKTATKLFCLAPKTVERWVREGRLSAHRAGKKLVIKTSDVRAIVEAQGPALGGKVRPPRAPIDAPPVDVNDLSPADFYGLKGDGSLPKGKRS